MSSHVCSHGNPKTHCIDCQHGQKQVKVLVGRILKKKSKNDLLDSVIQKMQDRLHLSDAALADMMKSLAETTLLELAGMKPAVQPSKAEETGQKPPKPSETPFSGGPVAPPTDLAGLLRDRERPRRSSISPIPEKKLGQDYVRRVGEGHEPVDMGAAIRAHESGMTPADAVRAAREEE